jgi:hypothetical protein
MKKIVGLTLALLPFLSFADCAAGSCIGVKVTRMFVTPNGGTVISTSGDESKLTCDAGQNGYIRLDTSGVNYNSAYSLLLTAHTTEHPIWIRTNDSNTECYVRYVVSDK